MNKPFASVRSPGDGYVKALYYAYGHNDAVGKMSDDILQTFLKVDAIAFADAYVRYLGVDGSKISIQDCFAMFLIGKTEFGR
jgi:hypothetical protein